MLYFAYGSNLNHFQMKKRCKDSKYIKKFEIKDFRLTFRSKYGVADIERKKIIQYKVVFMKYLNQMKKNLIFMRIFQSYIKKYILIMIVKKLWHTAWLKRVYSFTQAKGILM